MMQPSCPHCDQPDLSLLRLVLIGELLKADATWLLCLADVMQQCGLLPLAAEAEASEAPVVRPRTATLHTLHMDVMTSPSAHAVLASCHALAQALALTLEDVWWEHAFSPDHAEDFCCLALSITQSPPVTLQLWFTRTQVLGYATGETTDAVEGRIRTALETHLREDR
jgi:hypothetical protein